MAANAARLQATRICVPTVRGTATVAGGVSRNLAADHRGTCSH